MFLKTKSRRSVQGSGLEAFTQMKACYVILQDMLLRWTHEVSGLASHIDLTTNRSKVVTVRFGRFDVLATEGIITIASVLILTCRMLLFEVLSGPLDTLDINSLSFSV